MHPNFNGLLSRAILLWQMYYMPRNGNQLPNYVWPKIKLIIPLYTWVSKLFRLLEDEAKAKLSQINVSLSTNVSFTILHHKPTSLPFINHNLVSVDGKKNSECLCFIKSVMPTDSAKLLEPEVS